MSQPKRPLLIGLTGPFGSGCSTISKILEGKGFHRISLSEPIKAELAEKARQGGAEIPVQYSRKALQDHGNLRRAESATYWLDKALANAPQDKDLVIDGLRNLAELEGLRYRCGNAFVIAVVASKDTRWERVQEVYDKNLKDFDRDDNRDADEGLKDGTGQQVQKCVLEADYVFFNESHFGSKEYRESQLFKRVGPELGLIRGESSRYPTPEEVHMAAAYAESHGSKCLKRYVGAVIVSDKGHVLSTGFNENPFGMQPCIFQYNACYKDENLNEKLQQRRNVHCTGCGKEYDRLSEPYKCECGENLKLALYPSRNMEVCTAIHAEDRSIRSLAGRGAEGATMYVTTFPCFQCARHIVDVGISRLVYVEPYPVLEARKFLLDNGVTIEPFQGFTTRAFHRVFKQVP